MTAIIARGQPVRAAGSATGDGEPGGGSGARRGVRAGPVTRAEGQYEVHFLRYWVDEQQGKIFCLVEAPSADAAATVHREAHGLLADQIFEVQEGAEQWLSETPCAHRRA